MAGNSHRNRFSRCQYHPVPDRSGSPLDLEIDDSGQTVRSFTVASILLFLIEPSAKASKRTHRSFDLLLVGTNPGGALEENVMECNSADHNGRVTAMLQAPGPNARTLSDWMHRGWPRPRRVSCVACTGVHDLARCQMLDTEEDGRFRDEIKPICHHPDCATQTRRF